MAVTEAQVLEALKRVKGPDLESNLVDLGLLSDILIKDGRVYFSVGGTPKSDIDAEEAGGPPVPSHHSPFFKISPEPAVTTGVEATVLALLELMPRR